MIEVLFATVIITVSIVLFFYYVHVASNFFMDEFNEKKELLLSLIPFQMWVKIVIEKYESLL